MFAAAHQSGAGTADPRLPRAAGAGGGRPGLVGLIEVSLITHAQEQIDSFHQMLEDVDAILDAYKTTGDADYLLKVAVADLPALSEFISQTLSPHKSVAHIKTAVVLNRIKENGLLPVARES